MARWANRLSPLEASPRVFISDGAWSRLYGVGIEYTPFGAGSATASITILALQGPGVLNFLHVGRVDNSDQVGKVVAIIDGEKCYSASYSLADPGFQVVGCSALTTRFDHVPFRDKVTVFLEGSFGTATYSGFVAASWRLTDG